MKRGIVGPAFAARAERRGSSQLEPLFGQATSRSMARLSFLRGHFRIHN